MKKKNILISMIGIFAFIMMVGGVSWAYFVYTRDVGNIDLETGEIAISYTNSDNPYNNLNLPVMSDSQGMISPYWLDFSVTGTADIEDIKYELQIVPKSGNTVDTQYIKVYLTDQENNEILSPFYYDELINSETNNGKMFYQGLIEGNPDGSSKTTTKDFRLRLWIDSSFYDASGGTFDFNVYLYAYNVDASKYEKVVFDTQDGRDGLFKYVVVGEEYGDLPELSSLGFLGWNGKNVFNNNIDNDRFITTTGVLSNETGANKLDDYVSSAEIDVKPNTTYIKSGTIGAQTQIYLDEYKELISVANVPAGTAFTTPSNCYSILFNLARVNSPYSDVQLEEGNVPTAYEPYSVTSDVIVTREGDHVLTCLYLR